jgi:hypothetical protein
VSVCEYPVVQRGSPVQCVCGGRLRVMIWPNAVSMSATRLPLPRIWLSYSFANVHPRLTNTTVLTYIAMAKARATLRNVEHIDVHEDDIKEEDAQETMDESMDPLEESGHTVDSSDEEVEDSVQEDMARFEETFVGITKRFRLINRIGEGMSQIIGLPYAG